MAGSQVSNTIRTLRFHAEEMTQLELAKRVGVSRQTIVAIEKAKYSPSLDLAFRIARTFGKPLEEVFIYEAPSTNELRKQDESH
jgi:putative transcriptional regulator